MRDYVDAARQLVAEDQLDNFTAANAILMKALDKHSALAAG
ncbi:hypothetical protein ABIC09_003185 [Bradyrhizobium sp. S3.12.5]